MLWLLNYDVGDILKQKIPQGQVGKLRGKQSNQF